MKHPLSLLTLLVTQIVLTVWGTHFFQTRINPIAIVMVSVLLTGYCFRLLRERGTGALAAPSTSSTMPWLYALTAMLGLFTTYEELRKIWLKDTTSKISAWSDFEKWVSRSFHLSYFFFRVCCCIVTDGLSNVLPDCHAVVH